jgi:hypothetical protein
MIVSLIKPGFVPEQIEATVSCARLNLDHVERYVLQRPGERSRGTFAESPRS